MCKLHDYNKDEQRVIFLYLLLDDNEDVERVLGISYTLYSAKAYLATRFGEGCAHPYEWVSSVNEEDIYVLTYKTTVARLQDRVKRLLRRFVDPTTPVPPTRPKRPRRGSGNTQRTQTKKL